MLKTSMNQYLRQFMYPSDEKIALGCYLPTSSPSESSKPHKTVIRSAKNIKPLALLTISIESTHSIPEPHCTQYLVSSHPSVTNKRNTTNQSEISSPSHLDVKRRVLSISPDHNYHSQAYKQKNQFNTPSNDRIQANVIINRLISQPQYRSWAETEKSDSEGERVFCVGDNITDNYLTKKDYIGNLNSGISPKRLEWMLCRQNQRIMNEGEGKDFWDKKKLDDDNSRIGSVPGDETGSVSSSGSLHASDNSEDAPGNQRTRAETDQRDEIDRGTSTFLFLGPVGKKRKICRDRQKSGDTEQDIPSPLSLLSLSTPMGGDSDKDARSVESAGTPDLDISPSPSSSSRSGVSRVERDDSSSITVITSTPTPVIRSVPHRHREEQPLNLSLPSPSEAHCSSIIRSPGPRIESVHVSVISLAPREREEENDSSFQDISSPSLSFYSSRSPRESSGELTPVGARLSPQPSTSRGFHSISLGADSSNVVPRTFQGLLASQGLVSPNGSDNLPPKKKLQCRDCGKEFSQLRNYRYHRSRHEGTQQFACTCPVCGKTFNDKGYLSSHLKIHRNAKEYKCEWCEKSFNQRVAYNMHVRIHTGHKPHKCPVCPKAFSRKMLLRQHLRTHTGERPYKCEICGKAFADRSNMLLHQRLHSGQRPYKCDVCGKSFSKNHHLKTHLNHHAGIKPYQCEKCKACFSQSSNMKTHFRKCSGIPSATSTVTSGSSHRTRILPEPCSSAKASSSSVPSLISPPGPSRYTNNQENVDEHELNRHQHQQLIQAQQNHLQQRVSSHQQQQQQLLRSGHQSSSTLGQAAAVQALGLNLGIMGLANAGIRGRRGGNSGVNLLPLGSPSPTSLAAGHPFIPLASLESAASSGAPSPSSSMPTSPVILLSPRHHSNISDTNPGFLHSHFNSLSHSSHQFRALTSRSRLTQQQQQQQHQHYMNQHPVHPDEIHENRAHQLPTPQLLLTQRPSSQQRHNPNYRTHSPDQFEVLLPGIQVSRTIPQTGQQFHPEHFAQQMRPHSLHHQRVYLNGSDQIRQNGNSLSIVRPQPSGGPGMMSSEQHFLEDDSTPPLQYSEQEQDLQDLSPRPSSSWRHREDDDSNLDSKDFQFRGPTS